jgi:putative ABC transport system permease protein
MVANYLKIAWRNLMKNKVFFLYKHFWPGSRPYLLHSISLYIYHEISYDKHQQNGDRLYQLGTTFIDQGVEEKGSNTSAPLGAMLQQEYPEIEASTRILSLFRDDKTLFQVKEADGTLKSFYETKWPAR